MKVAIYIENGVTQLVLTPEGEWEESVTSKLLPDGAHAIKAYRGSFYECRGGYFRYGTGMTGEYGSTADKSLILRVDAASPSEEAPT